MPDIQTITNRYPRMSNQGKVRDRQKHPKHTNNNKTSKQTGRQTCKQADKHANRETDKQGGRQACGRRDKALFIHFC